MSVTYQVHTDRRAKKIVLPLLLVQTLSATRISSKFQENNPLELFSQPAYRFTM